MNHKGDTVGVEHGGKGCWAGVCVCVVCVGGGVGLGGVKLLGPSSGPLALTSPLSRRFGALLASRLQVLPGMAIAFTTYEALKRFTGAV